MAKEKTTLSSQESDSQPAAKFSGLAVSSLKSDSGLQLLQLEIKDGVVISEKVYASPNTFAYLESRAGRWLAQYVTGKTKDEISIQ